MGFDVYTLDFEALSGLAAHNGFDLYRQPGLYALVSAHYYSEGVLVRQFEDTRYGYLRAYEWMKQTNGRQWKEDEEGK